MIGPARAFGIFRPTRERRDECNSLSKDEASWRGLGTGGSVGIIVSGTLNLAGCES